MKWSRNILILIALTFMGPSVFAQRTAQVGRIIKKVDDLIKQLEDAINWGDALRTAPNTVESFIKQLEKRNAYGSSDAANRNKHTTQSSLTNPIVKAEGAEAANVWMNQKGTLPLFILDPPLVTLHIPRRYTDAAIAKVNTLQSNPATIKELHGTLYPSNF